MLRRHTHHQQQHTNADLADNASRQQQLSRLVGVYLENSMSAKEDYELEVRFGTRGIRGIKPIMRRDHEKVIEKLLSEGYSCTRTGDYHLRIHCAPEPPNPKVSGVRVEINGRANIQEYCKTNTLTAGKTVFNRKSGVYVNDVMMPPINFDDFNFRVSLQKEHRLRNESAEIRALSSDSEWSKMRKTFRYINRTSFEHPDLPLRVDLSVIKESYRKEGSWRMEAEYNFATSKVTESALKYEIEIEVLNSRVGPGKFINSAPVLAHALRGAIKLVLSGIQGTNFPISYPEMQTVYNEYHHMLHHHNGRNEARDRRGGRSGSDSDDEPLKNDRDNVRLFPGDFIGPSSVTLQKFNVADIDISGYDETSKPNIRFNYTVTEKADGQRKMLFVNRLGRLYLIDTAMNVQFTGAVCTDDRLHHTLIDGEHILHDKSGRFINLYAAFDIYYIHKIDIRHLAFATNDRTSTESNFRLYHLSEFMRDTEGTFRSAVPVTGAKASVGGGGAFAAAPIRLAVKRFEIAGRNDGPYNIFHCCSNVLNWINDGGFEYNTDGLIFTPANTGVCASAVGKHAPLKKLTWPRSFKWKPVEHNTIDFMVTTEKHHDQSDVVKKSCNSGEIVEYKTLTLRVGYSVERDGYLNPMNAVIDLLNKNESSAGAAAGGSDDITAFAELEASSTIEIDAAAGINMRTARHNNNKQVAAPFYPTVPPDDTAHICNIRLRNSGGLYQMLTESGEPFGDRTVVEFRYDPDREVGWRWVPIKVRHDKTLAREFGNAFHVANDNWFSIHNPLTESMLRTGANIFSESVVEIDSYYNRAPVVRDGDRLRDTSSMQPLRDFHNLFVKRALISAVCRPGSTLIDLAVGKAGDLHKWAHAELSFVLGIDIAEDNIRNRQDGAYARYLNLRKTNLMKSLPYMVFIRADSGKPIRSSETDAYQGEHGGSRHSSVNSASASLYKAIADTVFGAVERADSTVVGRAVAPHYAVGKDGFDVCSVQFALHYFWKDVATLHAFLRNVSETTKVGGHFIGTCYDGKRVYKMLLTERIDDPVAVYDDTYRCVWSITRQYAYDKRDKMGGAGGYLDDESSIGYAIDVYQDSINKTHREYLVNMTYLTRLMENYGFVLAPKAEAEQLYQLPNSMGSFQDLFRLMKSEGEISSENGDKYGLAPKMNDSYHSRISFLNNYFIFKKDRQVDAKSISEAFIKNRGLHEALQEHLTMSVSTVAADTASAKPAAPPLLVAPAAGPVKKNKVAKIAPKPSADNAEGSVKLVEVESDAKVGVENPKKRKYTRKVQPPSDGSVA